MWRKYALRNTINTQDYKYIRREHNGAAQGGNMYDVAIIGSGPAGLSAAINLKQRNKEIIWFGSPALSAKVQMSEKIANYPGLGLIPGSELNKKFIEHAEALGIESTDVMVNGVMPFGDRFSISAGSDIYEARAILLATGVMSGKTFAGEKEFVGRGVSYCATCDGYLYKGKTIAAYCGSKRYEEEIEYLAEVAEKVYLFCGYKDCEINLPNVEIMTEKIEEVVGEMKVMGLKLKAPAAAPATTAADSAAPAIAAAETLLTVDALFCLRDAISPGTLVPGIEMSGNHIAVGRDMATNIPGCFAAGDCTGTPYQIAKAVGEGNIAAHSILAYLSENK